MSWTDERIDTLKQLWGDGLSASQIATHLGGVTRNAVIGKVHRLKLDSRLKAVAPPEPQPAKPSRPVLVGAVADEAATPLFVAAIAPQPAHRPVLHAVMGATALKMEPETEMAGAIEVEEPRASGEVVPISRNLTLVQLSEHTCKWPLGDPLAADFRFCGNHARDASPYCQYHARLAFQPASERRRVR